MLKTLFKIVAFLGFCSVVCGQMPLNSQTNWERFAFQELGFSALLPKLPIVVGESNYEQSEVTKRFGAYSNGVAYVVSYSHEAKDNPFKKYQKVEPFTEQNFKTRLEKIRSEFVTRNELAEETSLSESGWQITQLTGNETVYKLYFDPKTNNWIELWAISPNDSKTESERFFDSLKIGGKPQGRVIGEGARGAAKITYPAASQDINSANASSTKTNTANAPSGGIGYGSGNGVGQASGNGIGAATNNSKIVENKESIVIKKLRLVLKPRANYSEEARKNGISGTLRLRVTFSSTGDVTAISAINSLPYGLTEQAIIAAGKILFIPEKHNGNRVSITRLVEYNFNLY